MVILLISLAFEIHFSKGQSDTNLLIELNLNLNLNLHLYQVAFNFCNRYVIYFINLP
jgi:hypothetical protein